MTTSTNQSVLTNPKDTLKVISLWLFDLRCRLALVPLLTLVLCVQSAQAVHVNNGFGFGSVTANAWCGALPVGAPTHTRTVGPGTNLGLLIGPLLGGGCNIVTRAGGQNGPLWAMFSLSHVGPTGSASDASDGTSDLLPFINPVSSFAMTELSVRGEILSSNQAMFFIDWFGSDSGTAARLQWFEGPILLHQELRVGPWNESAADMNQLQVRITARTSHPQFQSHLALCS